MTATSEPPTRAPRLVRLAAMCSYFLVARLGVISFILPWTDHASPEVALAASRAGVLYVVHYLLEAMLAWRGTVTMHGWRTDEVLKHHLTVGLVFLPACLCCALLIPAEWRAMLESHPPAIAVISSASVTGFNEGLFVLRTFLPSRVADAPATRWAQSCCTLVALLQNVPMTQAGCVLGAYVLLPQLLDCAVASVGARCMDYRTMLSLALVLTYTAGPLFFAFVQVRYLPANVRRVVYMTDFDEKRRR